MAPTAFPEGVAFRNNGVVTSPRMSKCEPYWRLLEKARTVLWRMENAARGPLPHLPIEVVEAIASFATASKSRNRIATSFFDHVKEAGHLETLTSAMERYRVRQLEYLQSRPPGNLPPGFDEVRDPIERVVLTIVWREPQLEIPDIRDRLLGLGLTLISGRISKILRSYALSRKIERQEFSEDLSSSPSSLQSARLLKKKQKFEERARFKMVKQARLDLFGKKNPRSQRLPRSRSFLILPPESPPPSVAPPEREARQPALLPSSVLRKRLAWASGDPDVTIDKILLQTTISPEGDSEFTAAAVNRMGERVTAKFVETVWRRKGLESVGDRRLYAQSMNERSPYQKVGRQKPAPTLKLRAVK